MSISVNRCWARTFNHYLYRDRKYFTVTAENAMKHRAANNSRKSPHSAKFSVSSSAAMYLYTQTQNTFVSICIKHRGIHVRNINSHFRSHYHTVLFPGDDVCSCSVASACDGTVPVPPVGHSHSHSPALLWRVSVWYPAGPLWAAPADCRLHTLAQRTGRGSQHIYLWWQQMQEPVTQNRNCLYFLIIVILYVGHGQFRYFTVRHGNYSVKN
jgi:hypothetical protein